MDELIVRVLNGSATPAEAEEVRRWRTAAAENEAYFRATSGVWAATEPAPFREMRRADATSITGAGGEPVAGDGRRRREARRFGLGPAGWGLALAAGLAALALFGRGPGEEPRAAPAATYVAEAEVRTLLLDDGSTVRLAPGSRLEAWTAEEERRYGLAGRAFFAVTPDPRRPFVVETPAAETRVLGTRFEVSATEVTSRTVVVEGRVVVANEAGTVEVPAGSVSQVERDAAPTAAGVDDVHALLEWPDGLLIFHGTPLATVANEITRHFGLDVEIADEALGGLRVTASFEEESFEEVVVAICEALGARCSLDSGGARVRAGG